MKASGRLGLCVLSLLLVLSTSAAAQTEAKSKTVRLTNQQNAPAEAYINFAPDSVLKPSDLPFCKVTGPLNCHFTLAAHASQDVPNPGNKYLNMAVAFNAPVSCGSTKAEVVANNPNWYDVLDVSVVDGFNERIQMKVTPTDGTVTQLGPPVGKLGNQKVFGVFPYGCTICAGIKNAPCGDAGAGECKVGSESKPDVLCQYQMNEPKGTIEVVLLLK